MRAKFLKTYSLHKGASLLIPSPLEIMISTWILEGLKHSDPDSKTKLYLYFSLFSATLSGYWFFFLSSIIWFLSSYYLSALRTPLDKFFSPLGLHLHLFCFLVFFLLIILNSASVKYTCLTRVFLCLLSSPSEMPFALRHVSLSFWDPDKMFLQEVLFSLSLTYR